MTELTYTIFSDVQCTVIREVAVMTGNRADEFLRRFRSLNDGNEPREGSIICGCRIDHIVA